MTAGPIILALALASAANPPHPPCTPDPTLTPRPVTPLCIPSRVGEKHGDWKCVAFPGNSEGPTKYDWMWVEKPKPPLEACNEPAEVCTHNSGYACHCTYRGVLGFSTPCEWQSSEKSVAP